MPVDTSIYSLLKPAPSPLAQIGDAVQLQGQLQEQKMKQQQMQAMQAVDQAMKTGLNADGTTNRDAVRKALINGNAGHLLPSYEKSWNEQDKSLADLRETRMKIATQEQDLKGSLAAPVKESNYHIGAFTNMTAQAVGHGLLTQDQAHQAVAMALSDPSSIKSLTDTWLGGSPGQQKIAIERQAAQSRETSANKPTEATLAVKAAGGDAESQKALDLLKAGKAGSAEQDDQRYRNIQADLLQHKPVTAMELAWAKGYEKQKTLSVDTSASAAGLRQAAAIQAQVAQQARAQNFTESTAGRAELTNKVEQPYLDSLEKADTLKNVVAAAKGGNMEAASVQSLLGTLGLVTTEGVKRINNVELGQVSGAGSLLERIKGQAGKLTSGQPLSDKLQNDLVELAGILEKSAASKYMNGHSTVVKRYGLKDEQPLPSAVQVTGGIAPALKAPSSFSVSAPNGKTYTFKSQADADAFKAKAGIK